MNLKVGQEVIVAIEPTSNASIRVDMSIDNIENWTYKGIIEKVGRKYVTVKISPHWSEQFIIGNKFIQKTESWKEYRMFLTLEEIYNERKQKELFKDLRSFFYSNNEDKISLDKLEKIMELVKGESEV